MSKMPACPNVLPFDIAATARVYSTLAGILAGFAFTSLILLVTVRLTSASARVASVAQGLLGAFLALLITSLAYAVVGGEKLASGRAASEEVFVGAGFAMSGVLLIFALVLVLEHADAWVDGQDRPLTRVASHLRTAATVFLVPIFVAYLQQSASDYRDAHSGADGALGILEWALPLAQFAAGVLIWTVWRRRGPKVARQGERQRQQHVTWFSYGGLAFVAFSSVAFALCTKIKPCATADPAAIIVTLLLASVALLLTSWTFASTRVT